MVNSLNRLRTEVIFVISKMALELPTKKIGLTFWINNLDLIQSKIQEYNLPSFEEEKTYIEDLINQKIQDYVGEELGQYIGQLTKFVRQNGQKDLQKLPQLESIITEFNLKWKQHLTSINDYISQYFPNFLCGAQVLHKVLAQFLVSFRQFLAICEQYKPKIQPIGIQNLLVEIKKYRSSFQ